MVKKNPAKEGEPKVKRIQSEHLEENYVNNVIAIAEEIVSRVVSQKSVFISEGMSEEDAERYASMDVSTAFLSLLMIELDKKRRIDMNSFKNGMEDYLKTFTGFR